MTRSFLVTAALLAAALSLAAQEPPPEGPRPQDRDGKEATAPGMPLEVRVYLWEKEKKTPVDIKDVTASLQVEGKDGMRKTFPMALTQPRPDDRAVMMDHKGQFVEVPGTSWHAEMVVLKADAKDPLRRDRNGDLRDRMPDREAEPRQPGALDQPDAPRLPGGPTQPREETRPGAPDATRPQDRPGDQTPEDWKRKDQEDWKRMHTHAGPYFKAELSRDEMPAPEFTASVILKVKGETKTVTGFTYPHVMKDGLKDGDHRKDDGAEKPGTDRPGPYRP